MPLILFLRHAENDFVKKGILSGNIPGIHLNVNGLSQAKIVAEKLQSVSITSIYTSPLERAIETAEIIARDRKINISIRSALKEIDYGDWQGVPLKNLKRTKLWKQVINSPSKFRFPNGESFIDAQNRIVEEIRYLSRIHSNKDIIVCVSHADIIKLAITFFLGLSIDMFQRFLISTCSITAMEIKNDKIQLINLNVNYSLPIWKY